MWSILENIACALKKNVYSAALGWNALKISIKSLWSKVYLRPLFPCWLSGRPINGVSGGWKSPNYDYITVSPSPHVHQDLLYILRCSQHFSVLLVHTRITPSGWAWNNPPFYLEATYSLIVFCVSLSDIPSTAAAGIESELLPSHCNSWFYCYTLLCDWVIFQKPFIYL